MWNEKNFNSGTGTMEQSLFSHYAKVRGIDFAIWVAKYYGVSLNMVKKWVAAELKKNKAWQPRLKTI
mgnify:CR=1 FL=1